MIASTCMLIVDLLWLPNLVSEFALMGLRSTTESWKGGKTNHSDCNEADRKEGVG